jgi:hypothetical protein
MMHNDFIQLLSTLKGLTPEQARQVRQQLDRQGAPPKRPAALMRGEAAKAAKQLRAAAPPKKKMTEDEFHRHIIEIGLMSGQGSPGTGVFVHAGHVRSDSRAGWTPEKELG